MAIKVKKEMLDLAIKEYGEGKAYILAQKMGIHTSYISGIRKHNKPVGAKFIRKFMNIMRLSFDSLFYYEEEEEK